MFHSEDCRRRDLLRRRLGFSSHLFCVSHSDIKIILLEITYLVFVIQDKATKKSQRISSPPYSILCS